MGPSNRSSARTDTLRPPSRPDPPDDRGFSAALAPGRSSTVKRTVARAKEHRITLTAAGVAFYWFLAVFPLFIAAVGILALVQGESLLQGVRQGIEATLPAGAANVLTDAISNAGTTTSGGIVAVAVGIGLALFSASSGMAAVQEGLDVAYDVPESRGFVKKRLVGIVLTLAALLLGGIATALLVFGKPLGDALSDMLPLGDAFPVIWTAVRWAITVLAVILLFGLFYRLGPNRRDETTRLLSAGGLVAAIIWLAASVGFSFYVSSFGGTYAQTYGSFAGIVVLLLWLFLSAVALLLGAELNAAIEERRPAAQPAEGDTETEHRVPRSA
jgi:membrane protein